MTFCSSSEENDGLTRNVCSPRTPRRLERSQLLRAALAAHSLDLALVCREHDLEGIATCVGERLGLCQALVGTEERVRGAHAVSQKAVLGARCKIVDKRLRVGHLFTERHAQSLGPIRRAVSQHASADEPEPDRAGCLEDLVCVAHRAALEERRDAAANCLADAQLGRTANLLGRKPPNKPESGSLTFGVVEDLIGLTTEQAQAKAGMAKDQARKDDHA